MYICSMIMKNTIKQTDIINNTIVFENDNVIVEAYFNDRSGNYNIWMNGQTIASYKGFKPFSDKLQSIVTEYDLIQIAL